MIYKLKGDAMKNYLERSLHMEVSIKEAAAVYDKLPLMYKGMYNIFLVSSGGVNWIAIEPKGETSLPQLRKNRAVVEKTAGLNCAVFLQKSNYYSREKMVEEGIPFVLQDKEIYLPFLGVLLSASKSRDIKPVHQISFLTQKILITGIYQPYDKATVTDISKLVGVSKMAVSKCFDEIEYLGIDVMDSKGKSRALTMTGDKRALWEMISPFLRDPVIKRFELIDDVRLKRQAGLSALCSYSLLSDNAYPTYAVTKEDISESGVREKKLAGKNEEKGSVVLELGYFIDVVKAGIQDPLSVSLSLGEYADDERVQLSVEEMFKEYVW